MTSGGDPVTDGYDFSDDRSRADLDVVWAFLSTEAYWGRWRTREQVERQVETAWRVVSAYSNGSLVGFARAVSDGVALGYLADLFVLAPHRGRGVATRLVTAVVEEGAGADFRWLLHTADAHGLYARFGFAPPDSTFLERPAVRRP